MLERRWEHSGVVVSGGVSVTLGDVVSGLCVVSPCDGEDVSKSSGDVVVMSLVVSSCEGDEVSEVSGDTVVIASGISLCCGESDVSVLCAPVERVIT